MNVNVTMSNGAEFRSTDAFGPNPLNIASGSTVVWINNDITAHNPVSDTGAFTITPIPPAAQRTFSFTNTGTFRYHCGFHPNMVGTIVVQ